MADTFFGFYFNTLFIWFFFFLLCFVTMAADIVLTALDRFRDMLFRNYFSHVNYRFDMFVLLLFCLISVNYLFLSNCCCTGSSDFVTVFVILLILISPLAHPLHRKYLPKIEIVNIYSDQNHQANDKWTSMEMGTSKQQVNKNVRLKSNSFTIIHSDKVIKCKVYRTTSSIT